MKTVKAADLLMDGVGEVVGCGERHTNARDLELAMNEHNIKIDEYEWYVKMKASMPLMTSGFGMGIERFFMWLLSESDIRKLQLLPRDNNIQYQP